MCPEQSTPQGDPPAAKLPPPDILRHVVDVHCHPTDSHISPEAMEELPIKICAMSTRPSDQELVRELANGNPDKVVPCFGYHPWFTHIISLSPITSKEQHYRDLFIRSEDSATSRKDSQEDLEIAFAKLLHSLPDPTPLVDILSTLRNNLEAFPSALLGEVGLDRASRIPYAYPAHPIKLTPFTIPLTHQLEVLEAQLDLAVEMNRAVSLHSVKAQMATKELIERMQAKYEEKWDAISVDLHSCGLSAQMWKDIEKKHSNIFLSLSKVINSRSPNHKALIAACAPDRILVESDYNTVDRCTEMTWDMVQTVAEVKGWRVEHSWDYGEDDGEATWGVVKRLEENWKVFKKGGHTSTGKKPQGKNRKQRVLEPTSDESSES